MDKIFEIGATASTSVLQVPHNDEFPPEPLTQTKINEIIRIFCKKSDPIMFEEAGCSVCGQLTKLTSLSSLKFIKTMLHILEAPGVTRLSRASTSDPIRELRGPVLDTSCSNQVCDSCRSSIRKGYVPRYALCRGLWLGEVPAELSDLSFYEKLLVARVRHSKCFVRVQVGGSNGNGHCKMIANVIAFENPLPKIY
ncbi:hypothetical protein C8J55DRAFT_429701, partial [Lentinula edodes]